MRRLVAAAVATFAAAPAACGADDDECSGFGCPTDSATAADDGGPTTQADPSTDPSASDDLDDDGSSAPTDASADDDAAASSDSADASTSTPDDTSTNCPMLGECFGVGVWESCDQFCEANSAVCVEGGCGGATVVYYGDAMACIDMDSNGEAAQSCADGFEQGGAVSFGRCCCDG
jgi:hypothetical protein